MLDSLIFSINTVVPIFIITALGAALKWKKFLNENFYAQSESFVFLIALPVMLFLEVSKADSTTVFDVKFIIYCVIGIIFTFLLLCCTVPFIIKCNDKRGAFIQGAYRSNFAILGVPLAANMFGSTGTAQIAMTLPFAITLFNLFAVMILSIYAPAEKKLAPLKILSNIIINIVKNPLIIAVAAALPFLIFRIDLPVVLDKSLTYLSNMSLPLALLSLGANCSAASFKGRLWLALSASSIKTLLIPLITVITAVFLGFRNEQLGVIFILFGGPASVSSYIMAKSMKSDYELAGQIILASTLMCVVTIFLGIFMLKLFNFI